MSNIICETNIHLKQVYVKILQKKIDEVCRKICFDDSTIQWHIYEPKIGEFFGRNSILENVLIGHNGMNYGYTYYKKREIWISTFSIRSDIPTGGEVHCAINAMMSGKKMKRVLLADVILDEITHIQTGCDHGNKKYDTLLETNKNKYYLDKKEIL